MLSPDLANSPIAALMSSPRIPCFAMPRLMAGIALGIAISAVCPVCKAASAAYSQPQRGRILLVRGGFTVFSLGLNALAEKLERAGYQVDVVPASLSPLAASGIADELESRPHTPLVIIGHSLGADLAPHLARYFESRRIPVRLAVLLDSPWPSSMPGNVRRCVNIYNSESWSAPVLGGRATSAMVGRTEVFNVDLARYAGRIPDGAVDHFTIDASPWIHQVVVRAVRLTCEGSAEKEEMAGRSLPPQTVARRTVAPVRSASRVPEAPSQAEAGPRFRR
jgi:hypothetical protein